MKIVIAGGGRIGRQLAAKLVPERHTVTVIDRDAGVCQRLFEEVGAVTVCGDATDVRVLEQAGVPTADVVAGLLTRDADSLAFAMLVRAMCDARVMVRVVDDNYQDAYRLAGVRDVIAESEVVVARIQASIEFPQIAASLPLAKGDAILFELAIPQRARVSGKTVAQLHQIGALPKDSLLVGLIRGEGRIELPKGPTVLRGGDLILVVARREQIGAVVESFTAAPEERSPMYDLVDALRKLDMFEPLRDEELADVLRSAERAHYEAGAELAKIGEPADRLFLVISGQVALRDAAGEEVARLGAREVLGDLELLAGERWATSATAAEGTDVVFLRRDALHHAADSNPTLAMSMSRALGQELARASKGERRRPWAEIFRGWAGRGRG